MTAPNNPFGSDYPPTTSSAATHGSDRDAFPYPKAGGGALEVSKPPAGPLAIAGALAVVGIAVSIFGILTHTQRYLTLVGWLMAAPMAIGVLGLFIIRDNDRSAQAIYIKPAWLTPSYWSVVGLSVVGTAIGAFGVATWLGHL